MNSLLFAYVDPSVMSYFVQAIAGVAIALGVVFGVFWRRVRKVVDRTLGRDESAGKEIEPPVVRFAPGERDRLVAEGKLTFAAPVAEAEAAPTDSRLADAVLATAFGAYFGLLLPLQTYLGNVSDYPFGLGRMAGESLVLALVVAGVAFALLRVSARWLGGWLAPVLLGVLVVAYVEASFLGFGIPEINGELPAELGVVARKVWDSFVLAALFAAPVVAFGRTRRFVPWAATAVLVLGVASLFDVRKDTDAVDGSALAADDGGLALSSEIIANVKYSPTRNVLLFVLDTMPGTVASEIMDADPALAAHFPGFTAYRNNIGMHDCTKRGVPALMTGRYYEAGASTPEYMMSVLTTNSLLQTFRDRGDAIYCILDVLSYGYTTAQVAKNAAPKAKRWRPAPVTPATEIPYMSVMDVAAFRALPFAAKEKFLFQKLHSRKTLENVNEHFVNEHVMYPALAAKPVSEEPRQMFGKFHTFGSHMPLMFDCDGNPVKEKRRDADVQRQAVSNALVHLSRLMDAYREKGVYDRSFIVVTTDHGSKLTPHPEGSHGQASAVLWTKPDGASAPFAESDLPTSHSRIAPLVRKAAEGPLAQDEVDAVLRCDGDRLFRYIDRDDEGVVYDWIFHPDGTFDEPRNGRPRR